MTQFKLLAFALGLASLALVLVVVSQAVPTGDAETNVRSAFKLPTLLDFQQYKRLFEKSYSDMVENLARAKLFLARAIRVFISAAKFRYKLTSFYLAINRMSDQAPHELDKMRNKVPARQGRSQNETDAARSEDHRTSETLVAGENVANSKEELKVHSGEEAYEQVTQEHEALSTNARVRKKRDAIPLSRRLAPFYAEMRRAVAANRILAPPIQIAQTLDTVSQMINLEYFELSPTVAADDSNGRQLGMVETDHQDHGVEGLPDEVFSDLRYTNCFFLPREQGLCYSSYAFAAISSMEYQHCVKTGELVAFSEQYIIDCGSAYFSEYVLGCSTGYINYMSAFFHHFGMELRSRYPYRERQDACPYPASTNPKKAGYLRSDVKNMADIHISHWPDVLNYQPLLVEVKIQDTEVFASYGGGVFDSDCSQMDDDAGHPMLVVGHGRENGQEYWLVRNCFGVGWGEVGHVKLAKRANCIVSNLGSTFGTNTGQEMFMEVWKNTRNDASKVTEHYFANIKDQPFTLMFADEFTDLYE